MSFIVLVSDVLQITELSNTLGPNSGIGNVAARVGSLTVSSPSYHSSVQTVPKGNYWNILT